MRGTGALYKKPVEPDAAADSGEGTQGGKTPESKAFKEMGENPYPHPMGTPINLDETPGRAFSNLSVVIKQEDPSTLLVQVLDMSGIVVTPIYSGELGAGRWVFEWDGRLASGRKAQPGYYQIEVKSGTYSQRKNIHIR